MKSPIGQRTLLSIAVAASLACISGGNVLADGTVRYCIGDDCDEGSTNWVTVTSEDYVDNLVLYDPDPVSTETGETIPTILAELPESGEIILTIEGTSESAFEDIKGTVYGVAAAGYDEIVSKANLTINVTNAEIDGHGAQSHRTGNPDSVLYGVYAGENSNVTFGDVTINIVNSILGSTEPSIEGDAVDYYVIGARVSDDASLTVGDVTITVGDKEGSEEFASVIGVKHNSAGTIKTGDIYVEINGNAEGGLVIGYTQGNFEKIHPKGNADVADVTVIIEGVATTNPSTGETTYSTLTGYVYGCDLTWMTPEVTIGDIVLELSNMELDTEDETAFIGLNTRDGTNELPGGTYDYEVEVENTVVTAKSVSVTAKNIIDLSTGSFRAVEKFDAGTVIVTGNVSLAADTMTTNSHSINTISQGGGTLVVQGKTSMYVKDVNSLNIYAFRAGHESLSPVIDDDHPTLGDIYATLGDIDLVYVSEDSEYNIRNNIYGAATEIVEDADKEHVYVKTIETGNISITIAGDAATMGFVNGGTDENGFRSIYGTVAGSGTITHGTRTLVFGYVGKDIDGKDSDVKFTSDGTNPFNATFSNFDEVVVKDGSVLYITSSQKAFNFEDSCGSFFDEGNQADDLVGLWSREGVLYLRDGTSLTVDEGGTADILTIYVNEGGTITVNGTLTTYGSTTTLTTYANIGGAIASTNVGTIEGDGTLVIAAVSGDSTAFTNSGKVSVTTGEISGIYSNAGTTTFTDLTLAGTVTNSSSFSVSGTATVSEDASASITNSSAGTVQISTLDVEGSLTFEGAITATDTVVSGTLSGSSDSTLTVGTSLSNSGTVALYAIDASGVTYTQTGSGTLTIEDGWFTGSTLNIQGGTLDTSKIASSGEISLGNNTVNISDGGSVITDTVTADTIVNIQSGGTFTVATIDLSDATTATITLDGGVLQTTSDQIFSDTVTKEVILMDSDETTTTIEDTVLATVFVGDVLESVATGLTIDSGGTITFTDEYYSLSMVQSAKDNLKAAGLDTSNLTIEFTGTSTVSGFTVAIANTLIDDGEPASDPGIILNTVTLVADENSTLTVGGTDESSTNILSPGMGFMNVSGAIGVTVNDGTFVLVGEAGDSYDGNQLLLNASDGGYVNVTSGTFSLGTLGAEDSSGGWIASSSISTDGAFNVKKGDFAVWAITNAGTITIDSTGTLHSANFASTGAVTNNGELVIETGGSGDTPDLTIGGTFENNGTLTATDVAETSITGTFTNAQNATAEFNGVEVKDTGSVANSGEMSADVLNTDSGTSVTNAAGGTLTVASDSTIGGTLTNAGTFTANGTLTVSSTVTNNGSDAVMTINSLNAEQTALINNEKGNLVLEDSSTIAGILSNRDSIGTADVEITGTATNQADATWTTAGTVTVSGGTLNNYGDMSADTLTISSSSSKVVTTDNLTVSGTLTIDAGSLDIQSGTFTAGSAALNGGTVTLGSSSAVSVELGDSSADIGSQVSVLNGSRLSIGSSDYGLDWADSETGSSLGNLVVVSTPITTTETGGISVGAESTGAGLYFSSDSTLVVSVDSLNGSAAFITTAGTTATVESGATLVLGGSFSKGDSYTILQGYTASIADDAWGYTTDDEQYLYGEDNNGLKWSFHLVSEDGTVYVQAVAHEDVAESLGEDLADPDIVNDAFDHCSSDPGSSLICGILTNDDLSKEDQQKTLNSVTEIAFAGGVMATTMTDVTAAVDSVHNHLTMDGDAFGKDGNLWPWDKSSNLWIDVLGSWQHGKHLNATSISNYKYRTNSYGFILGYDYKLPDRPVVIGGAFSFSDGDLKSKGGVSKTKNDYQTYGVSLYGNYSPSSYYNIIGSVHWFHNSADIKQYTSSGKATAKVQTNLIAVGLRGETTIKAGQVNLVPHAEARYIYGKSGKFTTKLDGANLWSTKADGTHTVQFPVGLAARTDIKTNSGWNIRPKADVSVIPQVGSSKQKSIVRANDGVTDPIEGQFMGKFGASVKLGVQADKSNATVGLRYGFLGGTKGRADHSVMLQGRLRF